MKKVGEDIDQNLGQAIQALESGEPLSSEMRGRIADKLKQSEQEFNKLRSWTKSAECLADIGTWIIEHKQDEVFWSEQTYRILGYDSEEIQPSFEAFYNRIHPDDLPRVQQEFQESLKNNQQYDITYRLQLPDGQIKYMQAHASHCYNDTDEPVSTIGTTQDVTGRERNKLQLEQLLDQNRTLLGEIHHRVKNNLAVVAGLLQLQWIQEDDPELIATLKESASRIEAVAGIHQQLYESGDFTDVALGENITRIGEEIINTMEPDKEIKLVSNCDTVQLNMNQTLPCTLIANEVVTNSIKHAFEGREQGTIVIDLIISDDLVRLEISDDGAGLPDNFSSKNGSLGINLIQTLSRQLDADYRFSSSEEGTKFIMQFKKEERER